MNSFSKRKISRIKSIYGTKSVSKFDSIRYTQKAIAPASFIHATDSTIINIVAGLGQCEYLLTIDEKKKIEIINSNDGCMRILEPAGLRSVSKQMVGKEATDIQFLQLRTRFYRP